MRLIEQIEKEIKNRKGITLMSVCKEAGISYQTVRRALREDKGITEETLMKLQEVLGEVFVLVSKDVFKDYVKDDDVEGSDDGANDNLNSDSGVVTFEVENPDAEKEVNVPIDKVIGNVDSDKASSSPTKMRVKVKGVDLISGDIDSVEIPLDDTSCVGCNFDGFLDEAKTEPCFICNEK